MKNVKVLILLFFIPLFINAANWHIGSDIGYRTGLFFQAKGTVNNFAQDFPLQIRLAISYNSTDPGKAWAARQIFINDNQNGTPEKAGWFWDARLDFIYPVHWLSLKREYFYAGPRYYWFTGRFDFVGGNEDFDVYSDSWGIGAGLEAHFAMSNKIDFILGAGLDYYITDHMHGHDTTYYSDGEADNGREGYSYDDADDAINQPKLVPTISIGINYQL